MAGVDQIVAFIRSTHSAGSRGSLLTLFSYLFLVVLFVAVDGAAENPTPAEPVMSLLVEDCKYDDGENLTLTWVQSIDDQPAIGKVTGYQVYQISGDSRPVKIADLLPGSNTYRVQNLERDGTREYLELPLSGSIPASGVSPNRAGMGLNFQSLKLAEPADAGTVFDFTETADKGKMRIVCKMVAFEAIRGRLATSPVEILIKPVLIVRVFEDSVGQLV
jgi:hypothetical protein